MSSCRQAAGLTRLGFMVIFPYVCLSACAGGGPTPPPPVTPLGAAPVGPLGAAPVGPSSLENLDIPATFALSAAALSSEGATALSPLSTANTLIFDPQDLDNIMVSVEIANDVVPVDDDFAGVGLEPAATPLLGFLSFGTFDGATDGPFLIFGDPDDPSFDADVTNDGFDVDPDDAPDLSFSSFGLWAEDVDFFVLFDGFAIADVPPDVVFFAGGIQTASDDLPTGGEASYQGSLIGASFSQAAGQTVAIDGTINLSANFTTLDMSGSLSVLDAFNAVFGPSINYDFAGNISTATSSFAGSIGVAGAGSLTLGELSGGFYGPQAAEAAGSFSIVDGGLITVGSFGAPLAPAGN